MLEDEVCYEGVWYLPRGCTDKNCYHCRNVSGFAFIPCIICRTPTSQCHLHSLFGVCRHREDHCMGYPVAHICGACFPTLNQILTDARMTALPPAWQKRPMYEPLRKWLLENWAFLND